VTFSWQQSSPLGVYRLEIFEPGGPTIFDSVIGGTSFTVSGLSTTDVLGVRLYSQIASAPDAWQWTEHRYNTELRVVSCADEEPQQIWDTAYDQASCSSIGNVCNYSTTSDRLDCLLNRGTGSFVGRGYAVSEFREESYTYDYAVYGQVSTGDAFCCLLADPYHQVQEVRIQGTTRGDRISLHDGLSTPGAMLDSWSGGPLAGVVYGKDGDDIVEGSHSRSSGYSERLSGNIGNDIVRGHGGNDTLYGGQGDDVLYGGPGSDTLYANSGDDILNGGTEPDLLRGSTGDDVLVSLYDSIFWWDDMRGEAGNDILCSNSLWTRMRGEQSAISSGTTILYYSEDASGSIPSQTQGNTGFTLCGHPSHGSGWGGCDFTTLDYAPPACEDMGIDD